MDVRATVEQLTAMGVRLHCLALGGVNLTSAAGKITMGVLSAVAEFERDRDDQHVALLEPIEQPGEPGALARGHRPRNAFGDDAALVDGERYAWISRI